jgi:hypothetical protein
MSAWNFTQSQNPTFKQILFTDADMEQFMHVEYGRRAPWGDAVLRAFKRINPIYGAARADLFRYALIYVRGGIYMDIKSASRDMSTILHRNDRMLLSHWPEYSIVRFWSRMHLRKSVGEYQQWWLAAACGNPAMEKVINITIDNIMNHKSYDGDVTICRYARAVIGDSLALYLIPGCRGTDILWTTGPFAFTRAIDHFLTTKGHARHVRVLAPDGDNTFIYDYIGKHRSYANHYFATGEKLEVDDNMMEPRTVITM